MVKAVLDTTVLVSAFLNPDREGVSYELLRCGEIGAFDLFISEEILQELQDALLNRKSIRRHYIYPDNRVLAYCQGLKRFATVVSNLPDASGVVVRDPSDDMIVACALAAGAEYIVTRDKDLLSLGQYQGIAMIAPEAFLHVLRAQE